MNLSIILPAKNESACLGPLLSRLREHAPDAGIRFQARLSADPNAAPDVTPKRFRLSGTFHMNAAAKTSLRTHADCQSPGS